MTQKIERLPAREEAPRVERGAAARIAATLVFALLLGIVIGAVFSYDFENYSVFGFAAFEAVFIGLGVWAFFWMRSLYRGDR